MNSFPPQCTLFLVYTLTITAQLAALVQLEQHDKQRLVRAVKRNKNGRLRKQRIGNRDRHRSLANREKLQALPPGIFAAGMRMCRDKFDQLLAKIIPILQQQRPRKRKRARRHHLYDRDVDPYVALAFTLRWLAGGHRWDLMYMFDVAKTTLHVWTYRVIHAIIHVLRDNIHFPTTAAALDSLAQGFANIAGGMGAAIPHTVCAFDGVVIQKSPPPQHKL